MRWTRLQTSITNQFSYAIKDQNKINFSMSWLQGFNSILNNFTKIFDDFSEPITKNMEEILSKMDVANKLSFPPLTIEVGSSHNISSQYLEFIHKIQQTKMKELWDNEYDEAWEDA